MITLGLTMGDPLGIGPEVILKALASLEAVTRAGNRPSADGIRYVLFGDRESWEAVPEAPLRLLANRPGLYLEFIQTNGQQLRPAAPSITLDRLKLAGQIAFQALKAGVDHLVAGKIDGLVTGPVDKSRIALATGEPFTGQTEYLAHRFGIPTEKVLMVLAGETLRVGLATTHLPVSAISPTLTDELISSRLELFREGLRQYWGIPDPHIGVCSLNPHGGDHGLFGNEEEQIIIPALERLRKDGYRITGPCAADSLFPAATRGSLSLDGILAMYHDQGLPALKMWEYQKSVNMTIGLPAIRVSPDHGTADNLAGTGKANCSSATQAIVTAIQMIRCGKGQGWPAHEGPLPHTKPNT